MSIGKRIIELRESKNWSQRELAKRVNLNVSVMNRIESEERPIKDHELDKFATILDVTADFLLGRTDNPMLSPDKSNPSLKQINQMLKKNNIDHSRLFDIEKWKKIGPEEMKQLENYFEFIVQEAEKKKSSDSN